MYSSQCVQRWAGAGAGGGSHRPGRAQPHIRYAAAASHLHHNIAIQVWARTLVGLYHMHAVHRITKEYCGLHRQAPEKGFLHRAE